MQNPVFQILCLYFILKTYSFVWADFVNSQIFMREIEMYPFLKKKMCMLRLDTYTTQGTVLLKKKKLVRKHVFHNGKQCELDKF